MEKQERVYVEGLVELSEVTGEEDEDDEADE